MSKDRLIILVKAPRVGAVKTRIAESAGAERACEIYRRLVERVVENLASFQHVQIRFTPDDAEDEIRAWLRPRWSAAGQGAGDLGQRLRRAFDETFAEGAGHIVIVGSDCPEVGVNDVRTALKKLKTYDVVIGPAVDGGYWLIGLRASHPELFCDIAWSSDQVLAQTLARAKALGLRIQLLRILQDVDTQADWNAYVRDTKQ